MILILASGCIYPWVRLQPNPYGTWKSYDPNIELEIIQNSDVGLGTGLYISDDEIIDLMVFRDYGDGLAFFNAETPRSGISIFSGTFRIKDDILTVNLTPAIQKETGYTQLVFERVEDTLEADE